MVKELKADVAIIGCGIAGYSAAISARKSGKSVIVIHSGTGATGCYSGSIDIAGDFSTYEGKPWLGSSDTQANISEIVRKFPEHPYGIFSENGKTEAILETISASISTIKASLERAGLSFKGSVGKLTPVPTLHGHWKLTSLVDDEVVLPSGETAAVLGIKGLDMPSADYMAKSLELYADKSWGRGIPEKYEAITVPLNGASGRMRGASLTEAAVALGDKLLMELIGGALEGSKADTAILPPIITRSGVTKELLDKLTGTSNVGMTLSGQPSAAGLRLGDAVHRSLDLEGITRIKGKVTDCECSDEQIEFIKAESASGEGVFVTANSYVVATGKFLGGGIVKDSTEIREPIFGLPLFLNGKIIIQALIEKLVHRSFKSDHAIFSVGIAVDGFCMRPLGQSGVPAYNNLFACGNILGGYNYATQGCGMGVSILTGTKAGEGAAGV